MRKVKRMAEAARDAVRAFKARYNEHGEEVLDDTPVAMPAGLKRPPDIHELIQQHVRSAVFAERMREAQVETFEEANDFGDDAQEFDDIPTLHEMQEELYDRAQRDADRALTERSEDGRRNGKEVDPRGRASDRLDPESGGKDVRTEQGSGAVGERARSAGEGHSGVSRRAGEDQDRLKQK